MAIAALPAWAVYVGMAAAAAGTAVTVIDARNANAARQQLLEEEMRALELAAIDEETNRLRQLRFANDEMLAHAGGVDAWASPSLVAARAFNFQMGMEDIDNIRFNLAGQRSGIATRINVLEHNSRAVTTAGILTIAGQGINAAGKAGQLGRTSLTTPDSGVLGGTVQTVGTG